LGSLHLAQLLLLFVVALHLQLQHLTSEPHLLELLRSDRSALGALFAQRLEVLLQLFQLLSRALLIAVELLQQQAFVLQPLFAQAAQPFQAKALRPHSTVSIGTADQLL
jgi:hypothetical protein